jgi:hypothetical protein
MRKRAVLTYDTTSSPLSARLSRTEYLVKDLLSRRSCLLRSERVSYDVDLSPLLVSAERIAAAHHPTSCSEELRINKTEAT